MTYPADLRRARRNPASDLAARPFLGLVGWLWSLGVVYMLMSGGNEGDSLIGQLGTAFIGNFVFVVLVSPLLALLSWLGAFGWVRGVTGGRRRHHGVGPGESPAGSGRSMARALLCVAACGWLLDVPVLLVFINANDASTIADQLGRAFVLATAHVAILAAAIGPLNWLDQRPRRGRGDFSPCAWRLHGQSPGAKPLGREGVQPTDDVSADDGGTR